MALNFEEEETERLATQLASLTGESKAEAVRQATRERLERLEREAVGEVRRKGRRSRRLLHRRDEACGGQGLRTLDSLHLASALALPRASLTFATWDARLHRAARAHGLATLPATLD
jgi:hypothetical protein